MKVALNSARLTADQHAKTVEELKARLEIAESKSSSAAQLDHNGWKAAVVTRMSEEKLMRVTSELETKVCLTHSCSWQSSTIAFPASANLVQLFGLISPAIQSCLCQLPPTQ